MRQAQIQAEAVRIRVQAKVRNLEQKIAEEIKAGGLNPDTGERRKKGCGPVCRSQRLDLAAAQTQLAAATKAEAAAERELIENNANATANQQRRLAIGGELAVAQNRKEIADANLAKAQTAMSKIITEGDTSDPTVAGGVISNVQLALTNFKNTGKISYMDEVTESCNTIYSTLSATETTRSLVSGQSCDSSAVAAQLDKLRRLDEGKTAIAGKCSSGEAFNAFEAVKPMIDMGRNCISLSGLGFEAVKPERDLVDQVEAENSPNTSNFQKTLATLKRGDDLALLTLGIAVSIDFFVFASALFAAGGLTAPGASRIGTAENKRELDMANHCTPIPNDDDPDNIRNLKLIVRTAQPMVNDPLYDEVKPDCQIRQLGPEVKSLSVEEQMLLKTHLTKFVSLGHAKFMGEDDPVFILSGVFYTQMTTDIGTYEFQRTEKQREAKERERIEKEEVARDPGKAKAQETALNEPEQVTDAYNGKGAQQNSSDGKIVSLKRLRDNFLSGTS